LLSRGLSSAARSAEKKKSALTLTDRGMVKRQDFNTKATKTARRQVGGGQAILIHLQADCTTLPEPGMSRIEIHDFKFLT
jgi:hypothetical protein